MHRYQHTLAGAHSGNLIWVALLMCSSILIFIIVNRTAAEAQTALVHIADGLESPVAVTHAGDGSGRLFITQQGGSILIFDGQQVRPTPFLDIQSLILSGGERGLLSVAFHPDYAVNGWFYVNYTDLNGDTVVARYQISSDPDIADPTSAQVVLTIAQPFANHNGGQLKFGPDGYLYVGMGDGGSGGDPQNHAQNLGSLLGKMLRIDVDGALAYGIPPDNPFVGNPDALPEIWALGLRNPWRFSFDRLTGDLWIADVGQNQFEEINFQPAGSPGGENYGWRLMEGNGCFNPATGCDDGSLTLPVLEYDHAQGCSVTGGYRYRGLRNPSLAGIYFYGDFCTGRVWGASVQGNGAWMETLLLDTNLNISAFGEDEEGELYVTHLSPTNGALYLVSEAPTSSQPGGEGPGSGSSASGSGGGCFIGSLSR